MGEDHASIHQCLTANKPSNMVMDDAILNNGRPTVIGRVSRTLPVIPSHLLSFDSRNNQLALAALLQIEAPLQQAISRFGASRIAVVIGTSTSGISTGEQAYEEKLKTGEFPADFDYRKQELGNCSDFIAAYLGLTGINYSISTACSSSGRVFLTAQRLLNSGLADAVIVGGVDSVCRLTLNGFNGLEALSNQLCRPFDQNRNGINIGEAASLMLLSKETRKIALLGAGDSSDAHHISAPHPEGNGAYQAMQKALLAANLTTDDIGYINAHGTATNLNDSMESKAIHRLFGDSVPVSSTKPLTGHTLGAASATEAAIAWHILNYQLPLPKQNCEQKAPDIEITLVEQERHLGNKAIMSNSFAFGGNNITLIFGYVHE
ncbi:hypothetical protein VHP8226_03081 [Vibrio hippocampi]|uniref:Ketosynthase family 3 (KS3) domain-containing protein n=2 Tax=Vibrio hippocampi TaxID=654686 RepID=A0ABM8ZLE5_9VIBR|nr:hypothetical protein VHP8226_03081 [Vibrio hippocampi]